MKSMKMIAAITVAALMIVSIGAIAFDASTSDADGGSSASMPEINTGNLMKLLTYNQTEPTEQALATKTYNSGDHLYLDKIFVSSADAVLTFKDGSALVINPMQSFEIRGNNTKIVMEKGSQIIIACGNPADLTKTELDKVMIASTDSDSDASRITGTLFNAATDFNDEGTLGFKLGAAQGTVVKDVTATVVPPEPERVGNIITFNEDNFIQFAMANFDLTTMKIDAAITTNVNATLVNDDGPKIVTTGSPNYSLNISMTETGEFVANINGDGEIKGVLYKVDATSETELMTATYSNSINAKIRITDFGDDAKQKIYFDGSARVGVSATNVHYEEKDLDGNLITVGDFSGLYANFNVGFRGDRVTIDADAGFGQYAVSEKTGEADLMKKVDIRDISVNFSYTMKSKDPLSALAAVAVPSNLADTDPPNPAEIIKGFAKQYFDGMATQPEGFNVREYAADFFFGLVGSYIPFSTDEMQSERVYVSFGIGSIFIEDEVNASGISGSAEISDSVGARVDLSVGKLYVYDDEQTIMLQPVNLSVHTSDDKTVFLEAELNGSFEEKVYDNGVLEMDIFVDGANVSLAVQQNAVTPSVIEFAINDLSVGKVGMGSMGLFQVINGIAYDDEKKQLTADNARIYGDYYGDADFLKMEGNIYDLVMPFDINNFSLADPSPMALFTIGSVDVRVYDLYGSSVRITRNYDAENAVINDRFDVDGQVWIGDILFESPVGAVLKMKFTDQAATVTTNAEIRGVLIANGPATPAFTIADDGFQILNGALTPLYKADKLTGAIYVSSMTSNGNNYGTSTATVFGEALTFQTYGCSIGVILDDQGLISAYRLYAMPEYRIDVDSGNAEGFSIDSSNDDYADITRTGPTTLRFDAASKQFNVIIDGETKFQDALYNWNFVVDVGDANFVFDENGAILGSVDDGSIDAEKKWTYCRSRGSGDLRVTTAALKPIEEIKSGEDNNVDADSVQFTFGSTASGKYAFVLSSGVRFSFDAQSSKDVQLIAKETNFNGNKAFIIKAYMGGSELKTDLYLPVGGEGQKVMHVDQYGRPMEIQSKYIVINGQAYQVVSVSNYSIFYTTADLPNYTVPSNDKNHTLLYIGIAIVVAIVALAGVGYFVKTKKMAA